MSATRFPVPVREDIREGIPVIRSRVPLTWPDPPALKTTDPGRSAPEEGPIYRSYQYEK